MKQLQSSLEQYQRAYQELDENKRELVSKEVLYFIIASRYSYSPLLYCCHAGGGFRGGIRATAEERGDASSTQRPSNGAAGTTCYRGTTIPLLYHSLIPVFTTPPIAASCDHICRFGILSAQRETRGERWRVGAFQLARDSVNRILSPRGRICWELASKTSVSPPMRRFLGCVEAKTERQRSCCHAYSSFI